MRYDRYEPYASPNIACIYTYQLRCEMKSHFIPNIFCIIFPNSAFIRFFVTLHILVQLVITFKSINLAYPG